MLVVVLTSVLQRVAVAGSLVFADGFESGGLSAWTHSSNVVVQQQLVEAGTWAAPVRRHPADCTNAYKTLSTGYPDSTTESSSTWSRTPRRSRCFGSEPRQEDITLTVGVNKSSKLFTYNPATGKTTVGPLVIKGSWRELQVHVLVNGGSSKEEVWLDGAPVAALSKSDTLGTAPIGRMDLGETSTNRTFDVAFDDVAVNTSFIDTTPPTTPQGLSVSSFSDQEVDLSWNASTDNVGVTGYTVYRSDDGGATFNAIGTSSTTNYADKTVSLSTTYGYAVGAFDAAGNHSSQSSPATVATLAEPDTQAPTQPDGLTTTNASAYEVDLSWNASSDNVGVAGYTLFRSDDGGTTFNPIGTSPTTSYMDKTVSQSAA